MTGRPPVVAVADRRSLRERCQRSPKRTVYEAAG